MALPEEIPAESDTPNKPVWEHEDVLLDTGELKGDKEDVAHAIPSGPHITAYFDDACQRKEGCWGVHDIWIGRVALLGQSDMVW